MLTNDVKIVDKMLVVAPDIRIWTAQTKLRADDFADDAKDLLPPSDLASLGTKRLIDAEKLRPFAKYKSRVVSLLSRRGIPFMPGSWLIPNEFSGEIDKAMESLRSEFTTAKAAFLSEYDALCAEWIAKHPEHEAMLRNSKVSPAYVRSRLSFDWRIFSLRVNRHSNIRDEIENLGNSVFIDIAKESRAVKKEIFDGRDTVTQRALNPIRNLAEKLRGLAFIHPQVAQAALLADSCLDAMPVKGNIEGTNLGMVLALLALLSSPFDLENATSRMTQGEKAETMLIPESVPTVTKPVPVAAMPPKRSMIRNVGLW